MTVYVAEIKGRGIAAFHADNGAEAERLVRDRVFRDDLMVLATAYRCGTAWPASRPAKRSLGRRRNGGHPAPRRFASAISRGKTIHGSLFSSHSPIPTDERGSFLWVFNFTTFLLSMDGDASTAGMLKLHRHLQKADPLFRSR